MGPILVVSVSGKTAVIDAEDWPLIKQYKWYALCTGRHRKIWYFSTNSTEGRTIYLHRLIMNAAPGEEVDHIDGNGLNNQRSNLRKCSHAQNLRKAHVSRPAASGYRGVYLHGPSWRVRVNIGGKQRSFGIFKSKEDAARVYDNEMRKLFGEFAVLNFPNSDGR